MNDENIYGGSPLDNIDYTAPTKKMTVQQALPLQYWTI